MRLLKLVPDDTNFDFVRLRGWAFGLTILLSVLAMGVTFAKGLNFGVDFVGGLMIEERFPTPPDLNKVREVVDAQGLGESSLQQFGDPRTLTIRLPIQEGADEGATNAAVKKVEVALSEAFPGATFNRYSTISGKVSGELIRNGVLAVILSIAGIGLFAIMRFEWQFGVSTVIAIVHDLIMTVGFFAITQFEFDLNIVAAVLTIVAYSVNDKIVIDDRIRENMRRHRKMEIREIVNLSVNETLPRTVMTAVTILLALGALLFLGGHVLRGFTAAMILGIIVGTYSSVYVASSLLITLGLRAEPTPVTRQSRASIDNAERVAPRERPE